MLLFNCSVWSDSWRLHGLQHTRIPCISSSPGFCSNSFSSRWWCHPASSSSVVPFSSCLQPFPASGSFPMSWLFAKGGQSIGASASIFNIQHSIFRVDFLVLSPCSPRDSQESSPGPQFESINSLVLMTTGKTTLLTIRTFVGKVMYSAIKKNKHDIGYMWNLKKSIN